MLPNFLLPLEILQNMIIAARWAFDFKQSGKAKGDELKWSRCALPKSFETSTDEEFSKLPIHKYSISVSNQFFGCELKTICNKIPATNPKLKTIYIVDLRQEPHLFWNTCFVQNAT